VLAGYAPPGSEEDLDFCLAGDTVSVVPHLEESAFLSQPWPSLGPGAKRGTGEGLEMFAKNILDKGAARLYSEVGHGGQTLQTSSNRLGEEVQTR
jgi:hypothetical protein